MGEPLLMSKIVKTEFKCDRCGAELPSRFIRGEETDPRCDFGMPEYNTVSIGKDSDKTMVVIVQIDGFKDLCHGCTIKAMKLFEKAWSNNAVL
jgi:hypothetical protein